MTERGHILQCPSGFILALVPNALPRTHAVAERIPNLRFGITKLFQCRIAAKCHCRPEFGLAPTRSWTRLARAGWAKFIGREIRDSTAPSPSRFFRHIFLTIQVSGSVLSAKQRPSQV